ncbi:MAG: fasciclin domain-containing protein [Pseudomonadota bacterium]
MKQTAEKHGVDRRQLVLAGLAGAWGGTALAQAAASPPKKAHQHEHAVAAQPVTAALADFPCRRFVALLSATGMDRRIDALASFTLFVPTDEFWDDRQRGAAASASPADKAWLAGQHVCTPLWSGRGEDKVTLKNLNGQNVTADSGQANGLTFWLQGLRVRGGRAHFTRGFIL